MRPSVVAGLLLVVSLKASFIFNLNQAQHGSYFQWKSQYTRSYQNGEVEAYRLTLWLQNYNKIQAHNSRYQQGQVSYSVALNQFSDMPKNQITQSYFASFDDSSYSTVCTSRVDPQIIVTSLYHDCDDIEILDQTQSSIQQCASGWAMAAATTLSILLTSFQKTIHNTSTVYSLSPQQLLDCTTGSYSGNGCYGGSVYKSWLYYTNVGGVLNSNYPYVGKQKTCNTSKTPFFKIGGCISVPSSSQVSLRNAVAVSPVVVEINGNSWGLLNYGGGIYDPTGDCNDYDINHSVTIIGFDYEIDFDEYGNPYNTAFFQAVNSFGSSWGESGHIRFLRIEDDTSSGPCGMYLYPSYPLL